MMKKRAGIIKKSVWLLLLLAAAICCIYASKSPYFRVKWQDKSFTSKQGLFLELKAKRVTLKASDGSPIWHSEKKLRVQDAFIEDVDRNGDEELVLLVWKRGKYGKHRPFWVKSDEIWLSQHIFIYDITEDGIKQKWFASDIGRIVTRMKVVSEENAFFLVEDESGDNTLWRWSSFGLKNFDNGVKFVAFGDNLIHKDVYEYAYQRQKGNFDFLYEPFIGEIQGADIAAIQAETVLVDKDQAVSGYPAFGSPIAVGEAIKNAGFDVAACANNHCLDKGMYGIDVSTDFYRENGITCVGIQGTSDTEYRPYEIISKNGIKFALFAYTYGTNGNEAPAKYPAAVHYLPKTTEEETRFVEEIRKAREDTDFTVVFVHFGEEYNTEVKEDQKHVTELLAEAGADVVIGAHPHVVQEMKMMDRPDGGQMLVYYSLGNFRSAKMKDRNADIGGEAVFTVWHTFDGVDLKDYEMKEINTFYK